MIPAGTSSDNKKERRSKNERKATVDSVSNGAQLLQAPPKEITNFNNQPYTLYQAPPTITAINKSSIARNGRNHSNGLAKQSSGATLPSAAMISINNATIPSARSPQKMPSGGLKSAKNADSAKFTFVPLNLTMDKALLEEINQLKQANEDQ